MAGSSKISVQMESSGDQVIHLKLANRGAFGPTMRHRVGFIQPCIRFQFPRQNDRDLGFFCKTAKPGSSSFLSEDSSQDSFFQGAKLLCNVLRRKVNPVHLQSADKVRNISFRIHFSCLKVQLSALQCFSSLAHQFDSISGLSTE